MARQRRTRRASEPSRHISPKSGAEREALAAAIERTAAERDFWTWGPGELKKIDEDAPPSEFFAKRKARAADVKAAVAAGRLVGFSDSIPVPSDHPQVIAFKKSFQPRSDPKPRRRRRKGQRTARPSVVHLKLKALEIYRTHRDQGWGARQIANYLTDKGKPISKSQVDRWLPRGRSILSQ